MVIPVESTMRTRRLVRTASHVGKTRNGFDPMFNSSSPRHEASGGGRDVKKFAEMSSASNECEIEGRMLARKPGS